MMKMTKTEIKESDCIRFSLQLLTSCKQRFSRVKANTAKPDPIFPERTDERRLKHGIVFS